MANYSYTRKKQRHGKRRKNMKNEGKKTNVLKYDKIKRNTAKRKENIKREEEEKEKKRI